MSSTDKDSKKHTKKKKSESVASLEQQIGELTDALQRERADAENIRKRAENDRVAALATGREIAVTQLLPLLDNIERAFTHVPKDISDNNWVKGVLALEKQMQSIMGEFGLEKIKAKGEVFDPEFMEAVSVEDNGGDQEIVSEELQSGYLLNGKPVRVAMVKITK